MLARKNWFFHLVHIHHIHLSLSLRSTLRACLFGEILERMENSGEKSREKEILVRVFSPSPPKCYLPKMGRKLRGRVWFPWLMKMPMCTCTWVSSSWNFFFIYLFIFFFLSCGTLDPMCLVGFDVKPPIYLYNVGKEFPTMREPPEANPTAQVKEFLA